MVGRLHCFLQRSSGFIALSCLQSRRVPALNVPWTPTAVVPLSRLPLLSTAHLFNVDASMSTSTADTASRREKAAQAAERRLQATAMVTAHPTASPSETAHCDSKTEARPDARKTGHDGGASRKRPVEQVGFSDSDSDEVACVGVSAAICSTQGRGDKGPASTGRGGGAPSNKRGRMEKVSAYTRSRAPAQLNASCYVVL